MAKTKYSKLYSYSVIDISEDDEIGYKAVVPKFPRIHVVADSPAELHNAVQIAIKEEIQYYKKKCMPIPKPDVHKYSGRFILRIRPELHEALAELSKAEGKTLNQYLNNLIEKVIDR